MAFFARNGKNPLVTADDDTAAKYARALRRTFQLRLLTPSARTTERKLSFFSRDGHHLRALACLGINLYEPAVDATEASLGGMKLQAVTAGT